MNHLLVIIGVIQTLPFFLGKTCIKNMGEVQKWLYRWADPSWFHQIRLQWAIPAIAQQNIQIEKGQEEHTQSQKGDLGRSPVCPAQWVHLHLHCGTWREDNKAVAKWDYLKGYCGVQRAVWSASDSHWLRLDCCWLHESWFDHKRKAT